MDIRLVDASRWKEEVEWCRLLGAPRDWVVSLTPQGNWLNTYLTYIQHAEPTVAVVPRFFMDHDYGTFGKNEVVVQALDNGWVYAAPAYRNKAGHDGAAAIKELLGDLFRVCADHQGSKAVLFPLDMLSSPDRSCTKRALRGLGEALAEMRPKSE